MTSPHALYCPVQATWPLWSGQLLRGVSAGSGCRVLVFDLDGLVVAAAEQLLLQASGRIPLLGVQCAAGGCPGGGQLRGAVPHVRGRLAVDG